MSEQEPPLEITPPQPDFDAPAGEGFVGEAGRAKGLEQAAPSGPLQAQAPAGDDNQSVQTQSQQPSAEPAGTDQTGRSLPPGWMPQIADDTDLIEKEWVDKAKEIVASTAHDPYQQNKEINKIRADYLKKRYNKEIKQSEP